MLGAAARIREDVSSIAAANDRAAMAKYSRLCSGLFRVAVKFATRNITEVEHQAIVQHLGECRCDLKQSFIFVAHMGPPPQGGSGSNLSAICILEALGALGSIMYEAMGLADFTKNKYFSAGYRNKTGQLMWPQGPEDLLPYGPSDSLAGLDLWLREDCGHLIFPIIIRLASAYKPFALCLVDAPTFSVALVRPLHHLTKTLEAYDRHMSCTDSEEAQQRGDFLKFSFWIILSFFAFLREGISDPFYRMLSSPAGNAILKQAKDVLGRVLDLIPWMRSFFFQSTDDMARLELTLRTLHAFARGEFDARGFMNADAINPGPTLLEFLKEDQPLDVILKRTFDSLIGFRKGACSSIECPPSSDTTHAMLCTQCQIVRFCGKECQTNAWKHEIFPHKILCQKIQNLREQLGSENWTRMFKPGFLPKDFFDACRQKDAVATAVEVGWMLQDTAGCRIVFRAEVKGEYVPRPWI